MADNSRGSGAAGAIFSGTGWFVFWLFTLGFADLNFGQGLLGLLVWPYYLGAALS